MNTYTKTLLAIGLSLTITHAYGLDKSQVTRFFANEVTQPFQSIMASGIFNQPIPQTFFNNLASAATIVKEFIETTGSKDPILMKAFEHAQRATNLLVNGIPACYQKLSAQDYQGANSILKDFITLGTNMNSMKNAIDKTTFYLSGKKEARDILATFAELLMFISKQSQLAIVSKLPKPGE